MAQHRAKRRWRRRCPPAHSLDASPPPVERAINPIDRAVRAGRATAAATPPRGQPVAPVAQLTVEVDRRPLTGQGLYVTCMWAAACWCRPRCGRAIDGTRVGWRWRSRVWPRMNGSTQSSSMRSRARRLAVGARDSPCLHAATSTAVEHGVILRLPRD